jgi:peroxiredoxin
MLGMLGIIQPFNRPILMMIRTFLALFLFIFAALASAPTKPLEEGDPIPDVVLRSDTDQELSLRKLVSEKPAVLIFYRGGWCPFCTRHLAELAAIEKDLLAAGVQLLAISMDQPSKLREVPNREQLGYRLLSDQDATTAKAFGIAFQVEDATVKLYKDSFNIDLEAASGRTHHTLAHPAVYIVDTSGVIRFAHVNPDYKVRLEPAKILDVVR